MTTLQRLTYTVQEVGELLGISRGSAYNRVRTGEIPALRMGRRLLVTRAELEDLLGAAPPPPRDLAKDRRPVRDIQTAPARRASA